MNMGDVLEWPKNAKLRCARCGHPFLIGVWMSTTKDDDGNHCHLACPDNTPDNGPDL